MSLTKNEIKRLQSLQHLKFRKQHELFLAEGPKIVQELLKNKNYALEAIYHTSEWRYQASGVKVVEISSTDLSRISLLTTPNEVLAVVRLPDPSSLSLPEEGPVLLLDGIQDPGNVGTIIRTADWFGIRDIILCSGCADIYAPKTVQAAMGSVFHVRCQQANVKEALDHFKKADFELCLADIDGTDLAAHTFRQNSVIIMGSEGLGPSETARKMASVALNVKHYGQAESLNVGVACGIICNALRNQLSA